MKIEKYLIIVVIFFSGKLFAQNEEKFAIHAQTTIINQFKPAFKVPYSGTNSLSPDKESQTSITSTLYFGARFWKGGEFYFNPELAGGAGLSSVLGVGDATNGETFRIGDHAPKIYLARLYYKHTIALSKETNEVVSELNQLKGSEPTKFLRFTIGKICLTDIFDANRYSHDPRTQFMCWGLMANGAWDYAANTRGYAPSFVAEYVNPVHEIRYVVSMVPTYANGPTMNTDLTKAKSQTLEYTYNYSRKGRPGAARLLGYYTNGYLGSYEAAVALNPTKPVIEDVRFLGGTKYGFGLNLEQEINNNLGGFFRTSWNDGKHETWAFTEIDQSISAGLVWNGTSWHRNDDKFGVAQVVSGLSKPHQDYLKAGGTAFMLGDGKLNYTPEKLTEVYYSAPFNDHHLILTAAYQILFNPGYNADRKGPVNIFSLRLHTEF